MKNIIRGGIGLLFLLAPGLLAQNRPLQPKVTPAPAYPYDMSKEGVPGTAVVDLVIDKNGRVVDARIVESSRKEFELPTLQAVTRWQFVPRLNDGRPAETKIRHLIEFYLNATPVYPFTALVAGTEGSAEVNFAVNNDGRVTEATVVSATRAEFGAAAVAAVGDTAFAPGFGRRPPGPVFRASFQFKANGKGDARVSDSAQKILKLLKQPERAISPAAELDQPLVSRSHRKAVYPASLRRSTETGSATVEFFVDEKGQAQLPRVISATREEFGYAAAQAVAQWRYAPPVRQGRTTIARMQATVEFHPD